MAHSDFDYGNSNVDYFIPEKNLKEYQHITGNVNIDKNNERDDIGFGCCCSVDCADESCVCLAEHGNNYSEDGRLLFMDALVSEEDLHFTRPVFECNACCLCLINCQNRVLQRGLIFKLQVYRTKNKGFGVKALQKISKGSYVIDYAGEILTVEEASRRIRQKGDYENNYLLTVRERFGSKMIRTDIDAAKYGNVSRFINHSCVPNLLLHPVRIDSTAPSLALFAKRDIEVNEELSFDYSGGIENDDNIGSPKTRVQCSCNTSACKGFLPSVF